MNAGTSRVRIFGERNVLEYFVTVVLFFNILAQFFFALQQNRAHETCISTILPTALTEMSLNAFYFRRGTIKINSSQPTKLY